MPGIPPLRSGPSRGLGLRSPGRLPATPRRPFFSVTERLDATGRVQPIMHGLPTSDRLFVGLDQDTFHTAGRRHGAYVSGAPFDASFSITADGQMPSSPGASENAAHGDAEL